MPDSDIPSVVDETDDDEATMMWSRDEFDPEAELPSREEMKAIRPPAPEPSAGQAQPRPGGTGLDEDALFSDVLEPGDERTTASLPVEPMVDETGSQTIGIVGAKPVPKEEIASEPSRMPSLASPASPSRTGLWVGLALAGLLAFGAAAYALRHQLGPLGAWLDRLDLPF